MRLFEYYERDTFLHRLNPMAKLVAIAVLIGALTPAFDPLTPVIFLLLIVAVMWTLGRIPILYILRALLPFWAVALSFIVFNAFLYNVGRVEHPTVLFTWGSLMVTREGLEAGFSLGMRAVCIVCTSMLFIMTTDPTEFALSLIHQARIPYRFGYAILVSYRFMPMLQTEYDIIRAAHRVRGVGGRAGLKERYYELKRYAIPLLASAIRKSERVAIAMDSKAFGALPQRTYYRTVRLRATDWLFLVAVILCTVAILLILWRLGSLRGYGFVPE